MFPEEKLNSRKQELKRPCTAKVSVFFFLMYKGITYKNRTWGLGWARTFWRGSEGRCGYGEVLSDKHEWGPAL